MKKWFYILTVFVLLAFGYYSNHNADAASKKTLEQIVKEQQNAIKKLQASNEQIKKSLKSSDSKISKLEKDNELKQQSIDTLKASNQSVEKGLEGISEKINKHDSDLTDISAKITKLQNDLSTSIKTTYITSTYTYDDTKIKSDLTTNTNHISALDKKVLLLYKMHQIDDSSVQKYFLDFPNTIRKQVQFDFPGYKDSFTSLNASGPDRVFIIDADSPYVEDFLMYITEDQIKKYVKDALESIANELYSDTYRPDRIVFSYYDSLGKHELEIK